MSGNREKPQNLEDVLDALNELAGQEDEISVADVQEAVGHRSFAPFLLVVGLLALSPVGAIPGVPTGSAVIVILTAGQLLIGRHSFWLPGVITQRAVDHDRLEKGTEKLRKPAQFVDRFLRPRLSILTEGPANYAVALACIALAVTMPLLEAVPFAVAAPAAAISAFALALVARDGLLAAIGYIATAGCMYLVAQALGL